MFDDNKRKWHAGYTYTLRAAFFMTSRAQTQTQRTWVRTVSRLSGEALRCMRQAGQSNKKQKRNNETSRESCQ